MVVLGSRKHYCINPALKKAVNKNDGCQDLLDDPYKGCLWKHNVRELETRAMGKIWDMEDMISNGKSKRGMSVWLLQMIPVTVVGFDAAANNIENLLTSTSSSLPLLFCTVDSPESRAHILSVQLPN